MNEHIQLTGAGAKVKRRELDYYPTPWEVTAALMGFLSLPRCTVWEPACGDGAMSEELARAGHVVHSSDIRDTGYGIAGVDFLTAVAFKCEAVITNPPFNESEAFIRRALSVAPLVAMLVKSQYWHAQKRAALFATHPPAYVLPLTWRPDFMAGERGGAPTMECIWTVWRKGDTDTKYRLLTKPT